MNTVILPAMTYGVEMWSLTKYQKEKLAVAQRSMERLMLNITWKDKIRNEIVRSKTQVKDVVLCLYLTLKNYFSYVKFYFHFYANVCMLLLHSVYVA